MISKFRLIVVFSVTWMKGVRDITNNLRSLKECYDDYIRFSLKRATPDDVGTYCILAKNVYGCDRAFFTVIERQRARSSSYGYEGRNTFIESLESYNERNYLKGNKTNHKSYLLFSFFFSLIRSSWAGINRTACSR